MTTLVGLQTDEAGLLRSLVELDFDALHAYDAALARLRNRALRPALERFRDDHLRHIEVLSRVLYDIGCEPPKGPDIKRVLTEGKVRLAGLVGDRAVLFAMKSNEADTHVAYVRATRSVHVTPQVRHVLGGCLLDERDHRGWFARQIAGVEPPRAPPGALWP